MDDEKAKYMAKMRPKNREFGGCVECAPCTFRPRDRLDDEDFLINGITKKRSERDDEDLGDDFDGMLAERGKK